MLAPSLRPWAKAQARRPAARRDLAGRGLPRLSTRVQGAVQGRRARARAKAARALAGVAVAGEAGAPRPQVLQAAPQSPTRSSSCLPRLLHQRRPQRRLRERRSARVAVERGGRGSARPRQLPGLQAAAPMPRLRRSTLLQSPPVPPSSWAHRPSRPQPSLSHPGPSEGWRQRLRSRLRWRRQSSRGSLRSRRLRPHPQSRALAVRRQKEAMVTVSRTLARGA